LGENGKGKSARIPISGAPQNDSELLGMSIPPLYLALMKFKD
jgi:hypothetical protein